MSGKKVELYEEDLLRAYDKGCSDVKRVLKEMFPNAFGAKVELGDRFKHPRMGDFILIRVEKNKINLADLKNGSRWSNIVSVKDDCNITMEEWERLSTQEFKKLP